GLVQRLCVCQFVAASLVGIDRIGLGAVFQIIVHSRLVGNVLAAAGMLGDIGIGFGDIGALHIDRELAVLRVCLAVIGQLGLGHGLVVLVKVVLNVIGYQHIGVRVVVQHLVQQRTGPLGHLVQPQAQKDQPRL